MKKSLTVEELTKLIESASTSLDRLMYTVAFNHGLRVSEVLSLTSKNIVSGMLVIQRFKNSKKTVQPILDNEREQLQLLAKTVTGPFFKSCDRTDEDHTAAPGKPALCGCRRKADRHIKHACAVAGISSLIAHFHTLKHTTGRLGFVGGMTVPELVEYLGHRNPANSLVYAQAEEEVACRAFAAAIGGKI